MPEMIVFILKCGPDVWIKVTFSCDYVELLHMAIFRVVSQIKAFAKGLRTIQNALSSQWLFQDK